MEGRKSSRREGEGPKGEGGGVAGVEGDGDDNPGSSEGCAIMSGPEIIQNVLSSAGAAFAAVSALYFYWFIKPGFENVEGTAGFGTSMRLDLRCGRIACRFLLCGAACLIIAPWVPYLSFLLCR